MHVNPRGPANPKLAASRRRKYQKAQLLEPRDFSVHTLANGERRGCKIARIFAGSKGSSKCESEHADQITRRNDPPYVHLTPAFSCERANAVECTHNDARQCSPCHRRRRSAVALPSNRALVGCNALLARRPRDRLPRPSARRRASLCLRARGPAPWPGAQPNDCFEMDRAAHYRTT